VGVISFQLIDLGWSGGYVFDSLREFKAVERFVKNDDQ